MTTMHDKLIGSLIDDIIERPPVTGQRCPNCGAASTYWPAADRYTHDGQRLQDSLACWQAISRGDTLPEPWRSSGFPFIKPTPAPRTYSSALTPRQHQAAPFKRRLSKRPILAA